MKKKEKGNLEEEKTERRNEMQKGRYKGKGMENRKAKK